MSPLRITWVYEPDHSCVMRPLARDERFIEAVGQYAGVEISYVEGHLRDVAPTGGFILLSASAPTHSPVSDPWAHPAALTARLVPLDVGTRRIFERLLESWSVAAAVDVASHVAWQEREMVTARAQGLYGLREIGGVLGASCDTDGSLRYCRMWLDAPGGLPELLARYLASLHERRASEPEKSGE